MDVRLMVGSGIHQVCGSNTNKTNSLGNNAKSQNPGAVSFADLLKHSIANESKENGFHVSSHAQKRLFERNIDMNGKLENTLNEAFSELEAKGARNSLVITGEGAFVINVPNRTLVTAMDIDEMKDGIITNIDSVDMKMFNTI